MREMRKLLISIVQDYCNKRGYTFESEKFALAFGVECADMLQSNTLSVDSVKKALMKFSSFVKGNDLSYEKFSIEIVKEICNNSDYIPTRPDFYTAITDFKAFVEGNVYPAFQVTKDPQEEIGRSLLQTYMHPRGFREAQMSGGKSDLVYQSNETVVETKIWRDIERYKDGIVELSAYLDSQGYSTGYYVLFDNTQSDNIVILEKGSAVFDIHYNDHLIHCFFIKINPTAPSSRRRPRNKKGAVNGG